MFIDQPRDKNGRWIKSGDLAASQIITAVALVGGGAAYGPAYKAGKAWDDVLLANKPPAMFKNKQQAMEYGWRPTATKADAWKAVSESSATAQTITKGWKRSAAVAAGIKIRMSKTSHLTLVKD